MNRIDIAASGTTTLTAVDPRLIAAIESVGADVGTRATDRLAGAHDASHYLLTPQVVVTPSDVDEVARVMAAARAAGSPVTFRSGGTSLSGQAGTDQVLIDTRHHFRRIEVLEGGERVRVQPGATVRAVNTRLSRYKRKLGPDPASEIACTIGGVIANNSSGMSCGTHANAYQTLESAVLVLPSGTVIDTGVAAAAERFAALEPEIHAGLISIRERIRTSPSSVARLETLHAIKNTMGYGLNSFLDHDDPLDILTHLIVGSEGTLAFVAEATFRTLPVKPSLATGLLVFANLRDATAALSPLVDAGFATIELLDAASLRVAQQDPAATAELTDLAVIEHAALLVEFQEESEDALEARRAEVTPILASLPLVHEAALTSDSATRAQLWHIRKGLFTAVAGARQSGTTALLEDIAVPVERLGDTCERLIALFDKHGYEGCVIFGHAKDGNIHFLINERFDDAEQLARYESFTEDMVELVLAQGGTLKAEHGTGRIMAPFVKSQYGDELYDIMWQVKRLIDPDMTLNPGVLLTDDPKGHTRNLKTVPTVESEVDRCVECGYCEPVCPSKDITLTPRERIVLRREMQHARDRGDEDLVRILEKEYRYDGVQTCAVDGMCQTACPVLINTGDLVRRLRKENQSAVAQAGWNIAAKQWDAVSAVGGVALSLANAVPTAVPGLVTKVGREILGNDTVPLYTEDLPGGGMRRRVIAAEDPAAVFFSSCTNTMFGPVGGDGAAESFLRLCDRAGVQVRTPDDLPSLCCGTPWKSKGLHDGYQTMTAQVAASLRRATDGGRLPVVCDASSCTEGLHVLLDAAGDAGITVVDAVAFVDEHVLPHLPSGEKIASVTVHPTCSSTHLGLGPALSRVAEAAAETVVIPENWGCCGFAGDRGMLHPELPHAATRAEAADVAIAESDVHASLNRTCELGMTRATGQPYRHILQVLDDTLAWPQRGTQDD
ncbi:MAG: FAD-binding and (Fe-S)-binding domain-containing protein [Microbacterium sp.]|uniref:FAD-binding and (Fe-S)-binding domain-containing protein n=1 Tax=Microbacterium sp. TaxID=51671 RepID=UPI003D6F64EB